MEDIKIRKDIIDACLYLKKNGLIARTWGNVSARLNDSQFIITPSGLDYELIKPEDLVVVNIEDCSYDHFQRKPSSEKLVHACAYKARKDVNFIVHTHQFYASAICAEGNNVVFEDDSVIPCAKYGLPSTKKLKNNCEKVFNLHKDLNIFLMEKHGAITFGSNKKEALDNAEFLEKGAKKLFDRRVKQITINDNEKAYLDDYAQMFPVIEGEDEEAIKMVKEKNSAAALYSHKKPLGFFDKNIQHFIYKIKYSKMREK